MSITKYESNIKHLACADTKVYSILSDLTNLRKAETLLEKDETRAAIVQQLGEEKAEKAINALKKMELTADTAIFSTSIAGKLTLHIIEREEPKLIKLTVDGSPVESYIWIQILPEGDDGSKIKITAGAELNFFTRGIANKYLPEGVNRIADIIAAIPYDKL